MDITKKMEINNENWTKVLENQGFFTSTTQVYIFWTDGSEPTEEFGHLINPYTQVDNTAGKTLWVKRVNATTADIFVTEG